MTLSIHTMINLYTIFDLIMTVAGLFCLFVLRDLTNGLLFWIVSELFAARKRELEREVYARSI